MKEKIDRTTEKELIIAISKEKDEDNEYYTIIYDPIKVLEKDRIGSILHTAFFESNRGIQMITLKKEITPEETREKLFTLNNKNYELGSSDGKIAVIVYAKNKKELLQDIAKI